MSEGAPSEWVQGCQAAHAALLADLSTLTDAQARPPSALPDWSVGHGLTHMARTADGVVRRLVGAARGEVLDQYAGGLEGRAHDIAVGADRPAAELVADVSASAAAMEEVMATLGQRTDPAAPLNWIIGRGEAPTLASW